jgi:hypothetical protein
MLMTLGQWSHVLQLLAVTHGVVSTCMYIGWMGFLQKEGVSWYFCDIFSVVFYYYIFCAFIYRYYLPKDFGNEELASDEKLLKSNVTKSRRKVCWFCFKNGLIYFLSKLFDFFP